MAIYFSTTFVYNNYLQFPNRMSGNENGNFDRSTGRFTAPVNGRYSFGLSLGIYTSYVEYEFRIQLRVNSGSHAIHEMFASGIVPKSVTNERDWRFFTTEISLNRGSYVSYWIMDFSDNLWYGMGKHTYFEGKLIKAT